MIEKWLAKLAGAAPKKAAAGQEEGEGEGEGQAQQTHKSQSEADESEQEKKASEERNAKPEQEENPVLGEKTEHASSSSSSSSSRKQPERGNSDVKNDAVAGADSRGKRSKWDDFIEDEAEGQKKIKVPALSFADGRELAMQTMHVSWFLALQDEFSKPYFKTLMEFLVARQRAGKTIFPPVESVFEWARSPISDVRVVIIGQDPYHGDGQAHGLSFSVQPGVPPPPSLVNIYQELESDIGKCPDGPSYAKVHGGTLRGWAAQGVLMLNAVLTVERADPGAHFNRGWEQFTDAVLRALITRTDSAAPPVFVLWGSRAKSKTKPLKLKPDQVIESVHPSPLSSYRGFFGSKPFSRANKILERTGQKPIEWRHVSFVPEGSSSSSSSTS